MKHDLRKYDDDQRACLIGTCRTCGQSPVDCDDDCPGVRMVPRTTEELITLSLQRYQYNVRYTKEWIVTCDAFPSLSWLADSPEKAFTGYIDMLRSCLADMIANKEHIP